MFERLEPSQDIASFVVVEEFRNCLYGRE